MIIAVGLKGKKMTLINAEKLKQHYAWWEDDRQKLFDEIVDQQKAIDAIPVEWILKWSAEYMEYGTLSVERMLEDWKADTERLSKSAVK